VCGLFAMVLDTQCFRCKSGRNIQSTYQKMHVSGWLRRRSRRGLVRQVCAWGIKPRVSDMPHKTGEVEGSKEYNAPNVADYEAFKVSCDLCTLARVVQSQRLS